jgi:hypothetical protein
MAIKCDTCGVESQVEEAFYKVQHPYSSRVTRRCPGCWLKVQSATHRRTFFIYLGVAILAVADVLFAADSSFGWFVLNLVLFYLCLILSALPHELGHALVAKSVGFRPFYIIIGFGRTIFERNIKGFRFELRFFPLGGIAGSAPKTTTGYRTKKFLIVLAGPLANLMLAVAIMLPASEQDLFDFTGRLRFAGVFFAANLFCFFYSLWPRMIHTTAGEIPSDGLQLWKLFRMSEEELKSVPVSYYLYEGAECLKQKQFKKAEEWFQKGLAEFPEDINLLNAKGATFLNSKQFPEAREIFLELLARDGLKPAHRCLFANNLAYVNTLIGGAELIEEADRYSKESMENMPFVSHFKGTRGCVLVELGRIDEGLVLLKEAMEQNDDRQSKATNACHIAIAEMRRGNLEESRKFAAVGRALDPNCMLLDRLDSDTASPA